MKLLGINDQIKMKNGKMFVVTWFDKRGVNLMSGKTEVSWSPHEFETMLAKGDITVIPHEEKRN